MPIVRKIIQVGTSKAISIPKSWLEYLEKETGQKITEVAIEVNDVLKIKPILENRKKVQQNGGQFKQSPQSLNMFKQKKEEVGSSNGKY